MARRKDHTREELYQMAVDAGRRIVMEKGADALTARAVAAAIGYTPGTLYNVFDDLDHLAEAINILTLKDVEERMRPIIEGAFDPVRQLRGFATAYLDLYKEQPGLWSLLFTRPLKKPYIEAYDQAIHRVFDTIVDLLLPFSGDRTRARKDAKLMWSTLHGVCVLQRDGKLDVTAHDSADALIRRYVDRFVGDYVAPHDADDAPASADSSRKSA